MQINELIDLWTARINVANEDDEISKFYKKLNEYKLDTNIREKNADYLEINFSILVPIMKKN